jgi:NTP pyrophosphatase (non-canonical NTP hydrolase)
MMLWRLQEDVGAWSRRNFPRSTEIESLLGIGEEYGELLHAVLKARQGIRGSSEEHLASEKDAVGDLTIYLLDYCSRRGFDLQEILEQTWAKVSRRDWVADPVAGGMEVTA